MENPASVMKRLAKKNVACSYTEIESVLRKML